MKVVYYHHPCSDGLCSAYLFSKAYADTVFVGVQAGTKELSDDVYDQEIYLLDISFPRELIQNLKKKNKKVVILDHHKTAQQELEGLDDCVFDMNKSGARLTWEYLWDNSVAFRIHFNQYSKEKPHPIVEYVEDRDLWLNKLPNSQEVTVCIRSYDLKFSKWDELFSLNVDDLVREGKAILRYKNNLLNMVRSNYQIVNWKGLLAVRAITQIGEMTSDHLNMLLKSLPHVDLAIGEQFLLNEGKVIVSLRSMNKVDCSSIAKRFGGGGHPNAAGFVVHKNEEYENYLKELDITNKYDDEEEEEELVCQ